MLPRSLALVLAERVDEGRRGASPPRRRSDRSYGSGPMQGHLLPRELDPRAVDALAVHPVGDDVGLAFDVHGARAGRRFAVVDTAPLEGLVSIG